MELERFMASHSKKDWSPGSVDCLLTLADWFVWRGFPDPASHLRGTYFDEAGFRDKVSEAGGTVEIVGSCALPIGLKRIETPQIGSIGIIGSVTNTNRQFGGIFDGKQWHVRFCGGFQPMIAKPLAIWGGF